MENRGIECLSFRQWDNGGKVIIFSRRPIATLLESLGANLVINKDGNISEEIKEFDLIISCMGKPINLKYDMVKKGAAIIDFGIPSKENGYNGDIDIKEIKYKLSWYTPVPFGVGPATTGFLFHNLFEAYRRSIGLEKKTFEQQFSEIIED